MSAALRAGARTDSELVRSTWVDRALMGLLAAAVLAVNLYSLLWERIPGQGLTATAVLCCGCLVYLQNQRLAAVLHRRTRRRTGGEDL